MDGEGVEAFLADAPPVTVGSHEPFVNGKAGLFTDGALDRIQAPFYFLLSDSDHKDEENRSPIDEVEYSGQGNRIATTPQT
jgi:hypothetical protein